MIKRYALPLSLLGVLIVIGAVIGTLIYPTVRDILDLSRRINEEKTSLEARYSQRTKVRNTIAQLSEVKAGLPELQDTAVPSGHEVDLVMAIEKLASINGVQEQLRLVPPQTGPTDYGRKLSAEVSLTGDSRSVGKFLSDLQRMDKLFVATDLNVHTNKDSSAVTAVLSGWVSWPGEATSTAP